MKKLLLIVAVTLFSLSCQQPQVTIGYYAFFSETKCSLTTRQNVLNYMEARDCWYQSTYIVKEKTLDLVKARASEHFQANLDLLNPAEIKLFFADNESLVYSANTGYANDSTASSVVFSARLSNEGIERLQ